jgi:hypothetical protein
MFVLLARLAGQHPSGVAAKYAFRLLVKTPAQAFAIAVL